MDTSAKALYDFLSPLSSAKSGRSLAKELAARLELTGEEAENEAVKKTMALVKRVRSDISYANFDEIAAAALRASFAPFEKLLRFEVYGQGAFEFFRSNLNPRTLQQLLAVHLALDSRAQRFIPEDELRALAASLSELREAVVSSGMPDDLKSAFEQRVAALQAAVSHYRVFGYDGLKEAITLLMGEVFVDTDTKVRQQHNTVFSRVRESMTSAATVLNAASQGATASNVIVKEGVGFVRNMVGLLTGHNILGP